MPFNFSGFRAFERENISEVPGEPYYIHSATLEIADKSNYHFAGIDRLTISWKKDSIAHMKPQDKNGNNRRNEDLPEIEKMMKYLRFEYRKREKDNWKVLPINAEITYDNTDILYNWYNVSIGRPAELMHKIFRKNKFYDLKIVFETTFSIKVEANVISVLGKIK